MSHPFPRVIAALEAIEQAATDENAKAGRHAIRECWDAVKELLSDDRESRQALKTLLEEISDDLKAKRYAEVRGSASQLREQLQEPLQNVASELTRFDHYIGHLCEVTYSGIASPELLALFGVQQRAEGAFLGAMKFILTYPLSGELEEDDSPSPLLTEKATQSPDSASQVFLAGKALDRQVDRGGWAELDRTAVAESCSRIELLTARLVQAAEILHPRPEGTIRAGTSLISHASCSPLGFIWPGAIRNSPSR